MVINVIPQAASQEVGATLKHRPVPMKTDLEKFAARVTVGTIPLWMLKSDYQFARFAAGQGVLPSLAPLDAVFDHYWSCALDFTYFDIGAKYGLSTIIAANYIDARGHVNPVISFEPGAGVALIGLNLAVNGLDDRVVLELSAVSDRCGETILYGAPEHPEDDHIIRRNVARPVVAKSVSTVSLDAYTEMRGIRAPLIVKVDTQGAEWEVWQGMRTNVESGSVTILTEFTPWTFEGRADPVDFLKQLADRYTLININPKNMAGSFQDADTAYHLVSSVALAEFTRFVAQSAVGWTDILCIPHMLLGHDQLVAAVLGCHDRQTDGQSAF
jgi:FkbM family methyltransferase